MLKELAGGANIECVYLNRASQGALKTRSLDETKMDT